MKFKPIEREYVDCKKCNRPYKKGVNYPDEVCPACECEEE